MKKLFLLLLLSCFSLRPCEGIDLKLALEHRPSHELHD